MTKKDKNICCPEFNPNKYDDKNHVWKDKLFLKDEIKQIFHIPINMGKVVTRIFQQVEKAGANPKPEDFLLLCYDPSAWKSEAYMSVVKDIPGSNIVKLSGTFYSKVFDGPYNAVPNWIKQMDQLLAAQGKKAERYYFHYAYCPKCSKKYQHNYCVAFAKIKL